MKPASLPAPKNTHVVMWIIWFAILNSLLVMIFTIGKGFPTGDDPADATFPVIALVPLVEIVVATYIRWVLIPRQRVPAKQLVLLIIGVALSEGAGMITLMLIEDQPATQRLLLIASVLGVLQMAPLYAAKPARNDPFRK